MFEPTGNPQRVPLVSPWLSHSEEGVLWAFMETAPVALLAADDDRGIVRVNERWCALTGHAAADVQGLRIDDLLAPESHSALDLRWRDLLASGLGTARLVLLGPDGSRAAAQLGAFANVLPGVHVAACIAEHEPDAGVARAGRRRGGQLTRREQESLRLVAMGMTTTVAAEQLGISPETVRTHVRNAMNKLGAHTRAQAIAVAMRDGEIPG